MSDFKPVIHFIGIGGAGMSSIAKILLEKGYYVSGSDLIKNTAVQKLAAMGAELYIGHDKNNISPNTDLVVVSSAIPENNTEILEVKRRGIELIGRGEMLARMMEDYKGIAVAGAHGKTTIASMIALCLEKNGCDPTISVGGDIDYIDGNAKLGCSELFVAEADESDGSFLKLKPYISVVSNVEDDHLDYYGTRDNLNTAFSDFIYNTLPDGFAVLCTDDPYLKTISKKKDVISYGLNSEAHYRGKILKMEGFTIDGEVFYNGKKLGRLELNVPGQHNMVNAMAAAAVSHQLGIDFEAAARALKTFKGVRRRFQIIGDAAGVLVVDDYAHHPTEIIATLKAAKHGGTKRVIVVFQPHRFTRTRQLQNEFGRAFSDADVVIINEIYGAGEKPISGVTSENLVEKIKKYSNKNAVFIQDRDRTIEYLLQNVSEGDLVITAGAGDVWRVGTEFFERLKETGGV